MKDPRLVGGRVVAVVMAGGKSERMRMSAGTHKALVHIGGITLLERNLRSLLAHDFRDIVVTVSHRDTEMIAFVRGKAHELSESHGASIRSFVEAEPLGNMGAVRELSGGPDHLLVSYVDNFTTFDLRSFFVHHLERRASLTIAAHFESHAPPFGELELRDGDVVAYNEKPQRRVRIASGFFAVEAASLREIPHGRLDAAGLFRRFADSGRRVAAFEHDSAWVDVNDAAALARAEQLLAENSGAFAFTP
jgi:NDP-sugar pyrophosphorylase family protein